MEKTEVKKTGLDLLREPFPEHQISLLPRPTKKDNPKGNCKECGGYHGLPAVHLKYVGHAALTDRLLEVDPTWSWEPMAFKDGLPLFDQSGGLWIKLTICGITRLGYGHAESSNFKDIGSREKEVIGDALRNAAMRFGAALDLWHKGDLHGTEDEVEKKEESKDDVKKESKTPEQKLADAKQESINRMMTSFKKIGVSEGMIKNKYGIPETESLMSLADTEMKELAEMGKSIVAKKTTVRDHFPVKNYAPNAS